MSPQDDGAEKAREDIRATSLESNLGRAEQPHRALGSISSGG